jgi:DNA replication and repair protein RecF
MKVGNVRLENFRNHQHTVLHLGPGVNVLLGNNGQGKTNILEAISCLGLTKSFYAANDATLVRLGQDIFEIEGTVADDAGLEYGIRVTYSKELLEKAFVINDVRIERLASVIGMFPTVILSPENSAITFGGPADRRRFIDLLLSQLSRTYFDDLLEYRQILRQRNRILADGKHDGVRNDVLEPWNHSLATYGARIIQKRVHFIKEFSGYVVRSYGDLVDAREVPSLEYSTSVETGTEEVSARITELMLAELERKRSEEIRRGLSLVGPHRDELLLQLNGTSLQKYASQGQHKTFLIALKIAEFFYLKEKRNETPILLLDDVLSELDENRSKRLLGHIAELGQTIITTTDESPFHDTIPWGHEHRKFHVEQGTCRPISIVDGKETAVGV